MTEKEFIEIANKTLYVKQSARTPFGGRKSELKGLKKLYKAINYTQCCESDSEQLKDEEIPKIDNWIKDLGYTQIIFRCVYKKEGTYKDREQLCKEYKKEFCL